MVKKIIKIAGYTIASIILLIIVGLFLFRIFSPSYLIPYVIKKVEKETNGRYTLSVNSDSLQIRFLAMSVRLGQTEFKRDTSIEEYSEIPLLNQFDVHANFESFNIKALHLLRFAFFKKLDVDQITLIKPTVIVRKNRNYNSKLEKEKNTVDTSTEYLQYNEADSILADTTAWGEFKESGGSLMPHLMVDQFKIENAHFSFYDGRKEYPIQEINGLTFEVIGFEITRNSDINLEDVTVSIDSASALVSKNTARLTVRGVRLHPESFHIDSLHFGHIVNKYSINKIKGFRAAWLDVKVQNIDIVGLHPGRFINDSIVLIEKATMGNVQLNLFKDKVEPKINPAHKSLPQEKIRNIPSGIRIDTVEIINADLIVDMEAAAANTPGQITFNQTSAFITNITNIEEYLQKNSLLKINLSTHVENKIPLKLDYVLKIDSQEDQFWAHCKVQPFNASLLNGFIGSQFFIEFKSGYIDDFEFNFEGNNKANVGEMTFEYTNLKVRKLHGHEKYLEGRPKTGFIASIGNMLIPRNRSQKNKNYKVAAIYYEKEYNRDMLHGTIMSMLSGIMSSVGLSSKNVEKMSEKASKLNDTDTQKSAEKAQREADKVDKQKLENKEKKKNN